MGYQVSQNSCTKCDIIQYSPALLFVVLSKLFNLIIRIAMFQKSYTVPLLKTVTPFRAYNESIKVEDFTGTSISLVISEVSEHFTLG